MKKIDLINFAPSQSVQGDYHSMGIEIITTCECINNITWKPGKPKCWHRIDLENQIQYWIPSLVKVEKIKILPRRKAK